MCLCALHTSSFCSILAVTNNMFWQARRCCIGRVSSLPSHFRFNSPFNRDQMWPWPLLASMLSIMRPCNDHNKARYWCTTVHVIQLWHIVLLASTPAPTPNASCRTVMCNGLCSHLRKRLLMLQQHHILSVNLKLPTRPRQHVS